MLNAGGTLDGGAVTDKGMGRGVNRVRARTGEADDGLKVKVRLLSPLASLVFHTREITRCSPSLCSHSFGPKPVVPRPPT